MQAEIQKADEGDEDLAKDILKRIANLQEEGWDGDVEAQFLRRIFRRVRKSVRIKISEASNENLSKDQETLFKDQTNVWSYGPWL